MMRRLSEVDLRWAIRVWSRRSRTVAVCCRGLLLGELLAVVPREHLGHIDEVPPSVAQAMGHDRLQILRYPSAYNRDSC